jgi:hypothetical protein
MSTIPIGMRCVTSILYAQTREQLRQHTICKRRRSDVGNRGRRKAIECGVLDVEHHAGEESQKMTSGTRALFPFGAFAHVPLGLWFIQFIHGQLPGVPGLGLQPPCIS